MGWLALAIFVLGSVLTFGLRILIHRRRTGDTGLRLGNSPTWATVLFGLAPVFMAAGPVAAIAGLDALPPLDRPAIAGIGLVLAVAGTVGATLAQAAMGASWRFGIDPSERTDLVMAGAFRVVRNPVYAAVLVISLGLALMVPNVVSLISLAVVVLAVQVQVRAVEEPHLTRTHGAAYTAYAAQVGRFVPGVGTGRPPS